MKLKNKSIIVTGSSKGIGKEIALLLAQNGAELVVNYHSNKDAADRTIKEILNLGGKAIAVQADVSVKEDFTRLFDTAIEAYGKVDVLINNAGIMINKHVKDYTEDDFQAIMNVNLKGVFNGLQEADEKLADHGNIINFSSSTVKMMLLLMGYTLPLKQL